MMYEQVPTAVVSVTGKTVVGDLVIEADGLAKRLGKTDALRGVSLRASAGTVTAILGPNGAGKSTLIRVLATLLRPDSGTARIGGYDVVREPRRVQALIGLTGQALAADTRLSGPENLAMFGRLHRLPWSEVHQRSARLLEVFGLEDARKRPVQTYSGGMRRKLDLALSLISEPPVLFLDEPTTGLDTESRHALWDIIRGLVGQGTTVLLTTQYLDEADALAGSVTFIDTGQVVATGTPAELKARAGQLQLDLVAAAADLGRLAVALGAFQVATDSGRHAMRVAVGGTGTQAVREVRDITAAAAGADVRIERVALHEPDLDDVYFQLTGHARPGEAEEVA
jgi:ABC-2 type transport system ATP-binding protein